MHGDESAYPNVNTVYALFDVIMDGNNGPEKDTGLNGKKNIPQKGILDFAADIDMRKIKENYKKS